MGNDGNRSAHSRSLTDPPAQSNRSAAMMLEDRLGVRSNSQCALQKHASTSPGRRYSLQMRGELTSTGAYPGIFTWALLDAPRNGPPAAPRASLPPVVAALGRCPRSSSTQRPIAPTACAPSACWRARAPPSRKSTWAATGRRGPSSRRRRAVSPPCRRSGLAIRTLVAATSSTRSTAPANSKRCWRTEVITTRAVRRAPAPGEAWASSAAIDGRTPILSRYGELAGNTSLAQRLNLALPGNPARFTAVGAGNTARPPGALGLDDDAPARKLSVARRCLGLGEVRACRYA